MARHSCSSVARRAKLMDNHGINSVSPHLASVWRNLVSALRGSLNLYRNAVTLNRSSLSYPRGLSCVFGLENIITLEWGTKCCSDAEMLSLDCQNRVEGKKNGHIKINHFMISDWVTTNTHEYLCTFLKFWIEANF